MVRIITMVIETVSEEEDDNLEDETETKFVKYDNPGGNACYFNDDKIKMQLRKDALCHTTCHIYMANYIDKVIILQFTSAPVSAQDAIVEL